MNKNDENSSQSTYDHQLNNDSKIPQFTYEELISKYLKEDIKNQDSSQKNIKTEDMTVKEKIEQEEADKKDQVMVYRGYLAVIVFITTIIITTLGAVKIGGYLDQKYETSPLFIILFSVVGVFASFRNLLASLNVFDGFKNETDPVTKDEKDE